MEGRDLNADPYSSDEKRVADYVCRLMGIPDLVMPDPVGFLIESHEAHVGRAGCAVERIIARILKRELTADDVHAVRQELLPPWERPEDGTSRH